MKKIFFAFLIACVLGISALAHDGKKHDKSSQHDNHAKAEKGRQEFMGKGDGVETCPVTGESITNKDIKGEFFGRVVYFCCPGCLAEAKKAPELYLKKTQAEQVAAVKAMGKPAAHDHHAEHESHEAQEAKDGDKKFLGKGDGIETCPVTGEPINKNVKAEILGRTVYFCCEECIDPVKKNPELYLKKDEGKKTDKPGQK